jgi:hypothetical protein
MAEEIKIDLDPKKVLDSLQDLQDGVKQLAEKIEQSLGKEAPKSIGKLEDAAEKGTNKISTFFRNLGTRVKDDLKTAFASTEILGGMKFAQSIGEGTKQVFEMERAFDRLNTRLGLTANQMQNFKKTLGQKVAGTGQKLEEILPGVESAAAKGGVKSPEQLTQIGEALGKVKATTGEGVEGVADSVIEILKAQGQKVTAESFKKTLDTIQGTRTTGAFKTAGEAGQAIEQMAPYAQKLGLSTREMGGLAATASKSGSAGQDILKQLMEKGSSVGGQQQLNAVLGQNIFKNGKLDAGALGKVNTERFGQYSQQTMSEATGLQGANGADLKRFVEAFKNNMGDFKKVVDGTDETTKEFEVATDNLASKIDEFKEKSKEVGREIGSGLSHMLSDIGKGQFKKGLGDLKQTAKDAWENKGTIAAGVGTTMLVGALAGGGLSHILGKVGGGLGKIAGGAASEAAAEAAGIQKVFVVNAAEMGGGGGDHGASGLPGKLGKAAAVAGVGVASYEIASQVVKMSPTLNGGIGEKLYDFFHPEEIRAAVRDGTADAHQKQQQKVTYTNPSSVTGRGGTM